MPQIMTQMPCLFNSFADVLVLDCLQFQTVVFTAQRMYLLLIPNQTDNETIDEQGTEINRGNHEQVIQVHQLDDSRFAPLIKHIHPDQIECSWNEPEIPP